MNLHCYCDRVSLCLAFDLTHWIALSFLPNILDAFDAQPTRRYNFYSRSSSITNLMNLDGHSTLVSVIILA